MKLKTIVIKGFKSFGEKTTINLNKNVTAIVGPNGSGKSNITEAIRFVLGEQSSKSLRIKESSDLLFKGSQFKHAATSAEVSLVFYNTEKDQTSAGDDIKSFITGEKTIITRVLNSDGTSVYKINEAKVRLKDVGEVLSLAGIGSHVHTIVSQGDSDKLLRISSTERRKYIEEALSIGLFQSRIKESRKKIESSQKKIADLDLIIRELLPLKKNLEEKIERLSMFDTHLGEFKQLISDYFHIADIEKRDLKDRISSIRTHEQRTALRSSLVLQSEGDDSDAQFLYATKMYNDSHGIVKSLEADYHRCLTKLASLTGRQDAINEIHSKSTVLTRDQSDKLLKELKDAKENIVLYLSSNDKSLIRKTENQLSEIINILQIPSSAIAKQYPTEYVLLKTDLELKLKKAKVAESNSLTYLHEIKNIQYGKVKETEKTRMLLQMLKREEEDIKTWVSEHSRIEEEQVRLASFVFKYSLGSLPSPQVQSQTLLAQSVLLERKLLRLEDYSELDKYEIEKEYNEISSRLGGLLSSKQELLDTAEKLDQLIQALERDMQAAFKSGLESVDKSFTSFFQKIVKSGTASLVLKKVEDENGEEYGIDIEVSLPGKKVKSLHLFSGGEKTLVSIALLFAMSQVTPPPFMVLDETDAPLDERNAGIYGKMLQELAANSTLIVITHNRETMTFCDMLYGVTMGKSGSSALLSVTLGEARDAV